MRQLIFFIFFALMCCFKEARTQTLVESLIFEASESCGISQWIQHDQRHYVALTYQGELSYGEVKFSATVQPKLVLICLDEAFEISWYFEAGSSFDDASEALRLDTASMALYWVGMFWDVFEINGQTFPIFSGSQAVFMVKLDAEIGEIEWVKIMEGPGQKQVSGLDIGDRGEFLVVGDFSEFLEVRDEWSISASGSNAMFAVIIDNNGSLISSRSFASSFEIKPQAAVFMGGSFYIGGTLRGSGFFDNDTLRARIPDTDLFLTRLERDGTNPWAKLMGGVYDKDLAGIQKNAGAIYLYGSFMGPMNLGDNQSIQTSGLNIDAFLLRANSDGQILSAVSRSGQGNIFSSHLSFYGNKLYWSGTWNGALRGPDDKVYSTEANQIHGWIESLDQTFTSLSWETISASQSIATLVFEHQTAGIQWIRVNFSGSIIIRDQTFSSHSFFSSIALKYDVMTSVSTILKDRSIQAFPNPAQGEIFVDAAGAVSIFIADMNGNHIQALQNGRKNYFLNFPPGAYLIVVQFQDGTYFSKPFIRQ